MRYLRHILKTYIIIVTATLVIGWEFFPTLIDYHFENSSFDIGQVNTEYIHGNCINRKKVLSAHVHLDRTEVVGKLLLRDWLDIKNIPTCIIIRASSLESITLDSTAYSLQLCIPRITFLHSQKRHCYYFYEWYIPYDLSGGMDWDIYFYGPSEPDWE